LVEMGSQSFCLAYSWNSQVWFVFKPSLRWVRPWPLPLGKPMRNQTKPQGLWKDFFKY
jgi:hypothetical protein